MKKLTSSKIHKAIKMECLNNRTLSDKAAKRFFKTSKDSYAANDKFLGITVPALRKIARKYHDISLMTIKSLLKSRYNEERLLALLILVNQYQNADELIQNKIGQFYVNHLQYVNNWNLVDSSAHYILGHYLWNKNKLLLNKLAKSEIMWERRVSIVATWYFIRQNDTSTTLRIARLLLNDKHDLIHKATGWMLREVGKKNEKALLIFLFKHSNQMPKMMLRYAMERLTKVQKAAIHRSKG